MADDDQQLFDDGTPIDLTTLIDDGSGPVDVQFASRAAGAMVIPGKSVGWTTALAMVGAALALPAEVLPAAIAAVATVTGFRVQDLMSGFLKKKSRRRRGRGVTGRQLAITRRTIRVVEGMHRNLAKSFGRSGGHHHSYSAAPRRKGK